MPKLIVSGGFFGFFWVHMYTYNVFFDKFWFIYCSAHIVRNFSSTPLQLAVRQMKVEKEKETVVRYIVEVHFPGSIACGDSPHLLARQVEEVQQGAPPGHPHPFSAV